ncbi:hypothetical protein GCM10007981_19310 [Thermocladium modestius]|uniref:Uncharacterized protein n=1 Tax=Thermocladium modestius TaxID=62609 RepID=A0A830GW80_9CREN|nr:hypothetical protein [Thermocladium modestius]GGP22598.1 hypothetical protein GCM10007981_19310 [Thermocladium modestius]
MFVVKRIGDREYVYARHGRSWHYIGPLNNVDLGSMLNSPTTSLPLKGSAGRTFFMSEKNTRFTEVLAQVVGIIIIVVGAIIILGIGTSLLYLSTSSVSTGAVVGYNMTMLGSKILGVSPSFMPGSSGAAVVIINASHSLFKIANQSAILPAARTRLESLSPGGILLLNYSEVNSTFFKGNYMAYRTALKPGQVLLVWPYNITGGSPSISIKIMQQTSPQGTEFNYASLLFMIPFIALGAVMIWGGVVLFRWGRRKQ